MNVSYDELPHIDQKTIECNMRDFTRWLNDLVDTINWLGKSYVNLQKQVDENTKRIECLEERVDDHEERIKVLEKDVTELKKWVNNFSLETIDQALNMINGRVDWIYDRLPTVYGNIPASWKFGMGTISVMSGNDGEPSIDGPGIFTRVLIGDDDLYFNSGDEEEND